MNDVEAEAEVIDLDSRRAPTPTPAPLPGKVGVFHKPKHPFTGKTPTERAIPTGGYRSKRQADLARKQAREDADRIAFYDAAYEATLDAALLEYYRKQAIAERVQENLRTPEDTLHALSCLRYRWIARVFKRPCFDYRYDLWEDGSIREIDAIRLLGLLGGIGLYVPRRAMPLIHKSDRWDDLPPSHLRLLAPYCSWIEVKTTPARSQEAARG
jgi:hypothetical protein